MFSNRLCWWALSSHTWGTVWSNIRILTIIRKEGGKVTTSLRRRKRCCFMSQLTNHPATERPPQPVYRNHTMPRARAAANRSCWAAPHQLSSSCGTLKRHSLTLALAINVAFGDRYSGYKASKKQFCPKWKDGSSTVSETCLELLLLTFSLRVWLVEEGIHCLHSLVTLCREGLQALERRGLKFKKVLMDWRNNL